VCQQTGVSIRRKVHRRGDDSDDHIALCFARVDPLDAEFAETARIVLAPMLKHMEVLE
jgi:hypothetical protein